MGGNDLEKMLLKPPVLIKLGMEGEGVLIAAADGGDAAVDHSQDLGNIAGG